MGALDVAEAKAVAKELGGRGCHVTTINALFASLLSVTASWRSVPILTHRVISKQVTINALFASLVGGALARDLRRNDASRGLGGGGGSGSATSSQLASSSSPRSVGAVVPVHLTGGVLPRGAPIGNRIGAVAVALPLPSSLPPPPSSSSGAAGADGEAAESDDARVARVRATAANFSGALRGGAAAVRRSRRRVA